MLLIVLFFTPVTGIFLTTTVMSHHSLLSNVKQNKVTGLLTGLTILFFYACSHLLIYLRFSVNIFINIIYNVKFKFILIYFILSSNVSLLLLVFNILFSFSCFIISYWDFWALSSLLSSRGNPMDLGNILNPEAGPSNIGGQGQGPSNNPGGQGPSNNPGGGAPSNNPPIHVAPQGNPSENPETSGVSAVPANHAIPEPVTPEGCATYLNRKVQEKWDAGLPYKTLYDLRIFKSNPFFNLLLAFSEDNRDRYPDLYDSLHGSYRQGRRSYITSNIINEIRNYRGS